MNVGLPEHFRRAPKRRKLMPQEHDLIQNLVSTGAAKSDGEVKEEKGDNEGLEAGELEEEKEEDSGSTKYNEKVVLILEGKLTVPHILLCLFCWPLFL